MRKLGFIFIVVCAGCFDFCKPASCPDHANSGGCSAPNCDCPLTSQLPGKNGTSCRGTKADTCSADDLDCICDPASLIWHCSRPDFATPAPDLARPRDMAHKLRCIGYRDCLADCYGTDPYPSETKCEGLCKPASQPASSGRELARQCPASAGRCAVVERGTRRCTCDGRSSGRRIASRVACRGVGLHASQRQYIQASSPTILPAQCNWWQELSSKRAT